MVFIEVLVVACLFQCQADAACGQLPGQSKDSMAFGSGVEDFPASDADAQ